MILLAGGTGRLGTALATRLTAHGLAVRVLTRDPARAGHLAALGVEVATGDVRDRASLAPAVEGAGVVVSAVHGFTGPGGVSPATVDYQGNINLIDAARATGAQLVLMSVAGAAADSPMELFRMKHAAEEHLRASGARWTIVRATAFFELWIDMLNQHRCPLGPARRLRTGKQPDQLRLRYRRRRAGRTCRDRPRGPRPRTPDRRPRKPHLQPARHRDPGSRRAHHRTTPRSPARAAAHGPDRRTSQARTRPPGTRRASHGPNPSRPRRRRCPPGLSRHPAHPPRHVPGSTGRKQSLAGLANSSQP